MHPCGGGTLPGNAQGPALSRTALEDDWGARYRAMRNITQLNTIAEPTNKAKQ